MLLFSRHKCSRLQTMEGQKDVIPVSSAPHWSVRCIARRVSYFAG